MPVKQKEPEKAKDENFDEFERLVRWRFRALIDLGLAPDQAMALVETPDIAHKAARLVELGCPPEIIASLLGGD